jgi:hypothetical protein
MPTLNDSEILERVVEFLKESSEYYSASVKDRVECERMFSGDFWTDERMKEWKRTKKVCEHLSQWGVFESAISSPLTASPWHAQLVDQAANPEIQDAINTIEADSDAKDAFQNAFAKAVDIGASYAIVTTVPDEFTGEPKIIPECVEDPAAVALDPTVVKASARDAEQGAVVNWISVKKARRLYGQDIIPFDFPRMVPQLYHIGDQWQNRPKNCVPIVTYYEKNESGTVDMFKLCGDRVVEHMTLPTTMIPIFRFAGYKVTKNRVVDYIGIVRKTYSLQLGLNLAYSTMLGRMNRSPKANFMFPTGAMDGLEEYLERCCEDDSLAVVFNPVDGQGPVQLKEAFETGDLQNVINTTQQLMAAVLGIPPTGIQGSLAGGVDVQRTATEVLEASANRESNVASLYSHSYETMRAVWMCVIEMLNGGKRIQFKLEAGPDVITSNMKRRQELQVMAGMLPPPLQPILAKYYADTLSTDDAKMLSKDIVANMDPTIKLVSDEELDAYAIHLIKQGEFVAKQAMEQVEALKAENEELKRQSQSLIQELANKREERQLEWNKALLDNRIKQAELQLDVAKAGAEADIDTQKVELEAQKVAMDAQDRMEKTIDDNNAMLGGV